MEELTALIKKLMKTQHFDCIAVAVLDFSTNDYRSIEISPYHHPLYFDLASITKPLTNGLLYLKYPDYFTNDPRLLLLLNHQAGLPSGGRVSRADWRAQILAYPISSSPSPTLYSDFSALRLMLELEKKSGKSFRELCSDERGRIIGGPKPPHFWRDLPSCATSPIAGHRGGRPIQGEVNDDNAYIIGEFCAHAGLFASIDELCSTLLYLHRQYHLLEVLEREFLTNPPPSSQRFLCGWDRPLDQQTTLAGKGTTPKTIGHLGFTGTSCWISLDDKLGHVILTNATKSFSHDRAGLNQIRRAIGGCIWENGRTLFA